jgi:hypothetical protein
METATFKQIAKQTPIKQASVKKRRKRIILINKPAKRNFKVVQLIDKCAKYLKGKSLKRKDFLNFWCSKRGLNKDVDTFNPKIKDDDDVDGYVLFISSNRYAESFINFIKKEYHDVS